MDGVEQDICTITSRNESPHWMTAKVKVCSGEIEGGGRAVEKKNMRTEIVNSWTILAFDDLRQISSVYIYIFFSLTRAIWCGRALDFYSSDVLFL